MKYRCIVSYYFKSMRITSKSFFTLCDEHMCVCVLLFTYVTYQYDYLVCLDCVIASIVGHLSKSHCHYLRVVFQDIRQIGIVI